MAHVTLSHNIIGQALDWPLSQQRLTITSGDVLTATGFRMQVVVQLLELQQDRPN